MSPKRNESHALRLLCGVRIRRRRPPVPATSSCRSSKLRSDYNPGLYSNAGQQRAILRRNFASPSSEVFSRTRKRVSLYARETARVANTSLKVVFRSWNFLAPGDSFRRSQLRLRFTVQHSRCRLRRKEFCSWKTVRHRYINYIMHSRFLQQFSLQISRLGAEHSYNRERFTT